MSKVVTVEAFFPEVSSTKANQVGRGEASNWPLALYRAVKEIVKRDGISRHRISSVKLVVSIGSSPINKLEEKEGEDE